MLELISFLKSDQTCFLFIFGALGGFISLILKDNCIELPKKIDGKLYLGGLNAIILGGIAGYFADGSLLTAFIGGFAGKEIVEKLLAKKVEDKNILAKICDEDENKSVDTTENINQEVAASVPIFTNIEAMIRWKAARAGVSPDLAVAVARAESGLKANAINVNNGGSKDRGLYQWNDKYHPEITDEMAFDPEVATDLFLKAVKDGHLSWWSASRAGWKQYE